MWEVPDLQEWRVISECCFEPLNCGQLCDSVENENIKPTSSSLAETAAPGIILGHEKNHCALWSWDDAMLYSLDVFSLKMKAILFENSEAAAGLFISLSASTQLLPSEMFASIDSGSSMTSSNLWSLVIHRDMYYYMSSTNWVFSPSWAQWMPRSLAPLK